MTVTRRGLLLGTAGALAARSVGAGTVEHFEGYPGRYGLLHDTTLCVGCRSCEVACKEVNGLPPFEGEAIGDRSAFDTTRRTTDTTLTIVNQYRDAADGAPPVYRKLQCMHCNEPCCAAVCPVHAFSKTPEGPVLYDAEVCMGCRYCITACPYYALAYEYDNPLTPRVMRCTMCYPRIKEGLDPACAEVCPVGAISFGEREQLLQVARERIRKFPDRYIDHIFGEHEFGGTSWLILAGIPFEQMELLPGVTHESLPSIGTSYLGVVPLVITIYPGLLAGFYAFSKRKERLANEEQEAAVAAALERAGEDSRQKLAAAADKARTDQERAVQQAVQRALVEQQKKETGS